MELKCIVIQLLNYFKETICFFGSLMFPVLGIWVLLYQLSPSGSEAPERAQCMQRYTVLSFKSSSSTATSLQLVCAVLPLWLAVAVYCPLSFTKGVLTCSRRLFGHLPPMHWPSALLVPHSASTQENSREASLCERRMFWCVHETGSVDTVEILDKFCFLHMTL